MTGIPHPPPVLDARGVYAGLTGICSIIFHATQGLFPALFPEYGGAVPIWLRSLVINVLLLAVAVVTVLAAGRRADSFCTSSSQRTRMPLSAWRM